MYSIVDTRGQVEYSGSVPLPSLDGVTVQENENRLITPPARDSEENNLQVSYSDPIHHRRICYEGS